MKLDPKLKEKWVQALRSGKYEQGQGELRIQVLSGEYKYCCLGVLCDVLKPEGMSFFEMVGTEHGGLLPKHVALDIGLKNPNYNPVTDSKIHEFFADFDVEILQDDGSNSITPTFEIRRTNLACLNDDGHTFEEIASIIEEQL